MNSIVYLIAGLIMMSAVAVWGACWLGSAGVPPAASGLWPEDRDFGEEWQRESRLAGGQPERSGRPRSPDHFGRELRIMKEGEIKYFVKFRGQPLNFWQKCNTKQWVASVVAADKYATRFDGKGEAIAQVKVCRLEESQVTYHVVK